MINTTASFGALRDSWQAFTNHWQLSAFVSLVSAFFTYLVGVENQEILLVLVVMIFIDTVLGTLVSIKTQRFNARGMGKGVVKVILYGSFLIMFHLSEIIIDGAAGIQLHMIDMAGYLYLIIREAKSSNEKLAVFSIGLPINPFMAIEKMLNRYSEDFEEYLHEKNKKR